MPNIRKIETKPVVKKDMLEIEARVIDYLLTKRPFIGPQKKHYKESAEKKKRENEVWRLKL